MIIFLILAILLFVIFFGIATFITMKKSRPEISVILYSIGLFLFIGFFILFNKTKTKIETKTIITQTYELQYDIVKVIGEFSQFKEKEIATIFIKSRTQSAETIVKFLLPQWTDNAIYELLHNYEFH